MNVMLLGFHPVTITRNIQKHYVQASAHAPLSNKRNAAQEAWLLGFLDPGSHRVGLVM